MYNRFARLKYYKNLTHDLIKYTYITRFHLKKNRNSIVFFKTNNFALQYSYNLSDQRFANVIQ